MQLIKEKSKADGLKNEEKVNIRELKEINNFNEVLVNEIETLLIESEVDRDKK